MIPALLNHLWQSSACLAVAALLALLLRRHPARFRFWVWSAASLKFLVPFTAIAGLWPTVHDQPAPQAAVRITQPFAASDPAPDFSPLAAPAAHINWHWLFAALWIAGAAAVLAVWAWRWRRLAAVRQTGRAASGAIPVVLTEEPIEPGVFGIFHPVLLLPQDLPARLTSRQMEAVIAHELCHVRRRDNLWSALHLMVEAAFWFFPPVWWLGARLVAERERACDESVLARGIDAEVYAAGVVQVCRWHANAPLACMAGVAGGDLTRRVRGILGFAALRRLSRPAQLALVALLLALIALPMAARHLFAQQAAAPRPSFDVAAIRAWEPGQPEGGYTASVQALPGRIVAQCVNLHALLYYAFHLTGSEPIENLPGWSNAACGGGTWDTYTLQATMPANTSQDQARAMMQSLLADRFRLVAHWDTRRMKMYALVVAPGGFKVAASDPKNDKPLPRGSFVCPASDPNCNTALCCGSMKLSTVAWMLTNYLRRPVIDETDLKGAYDFKMIMWAGDDATASPLPSLPQLLRQYGLALKPGTGPVPVLVIDHVEKLRPE